MNTAAKLISSSRSSPPEATISFLRRLYRGWLRFAKLLGLINSRIIFSLIYLIVFGIYNLIYRLGRLIKRAPANKPSYWQPKTPRPHNDDWLRRQF
ncbi:MAG: hypothetical protein HYV42_04875 [Candidatus Magasanikbacteria bacterium]|nr:hypothetical protein [Candidatus Magasanikbacteria bacterium]